MKLMYCAVICLFCTGMLSAKQSFVIDTDVGVDDALAILFTAKHPEARLEGLTCVFGNVPVDQAAKNCGVILDVAEYPNDVPVYVGCPERLVQVYAPLNSWPGHGENGLGGADFPISSRPIVEGKHASQALIDLSREHEGLTLVALGPLSNLALAARLDPELPSRVGSLVIMGGTMEGRGNVAPSVEFNFGCDPEAAEIVLEAFAGKIQLVTWELTESAAFTWEWREQVTQNAECNELQAFLRDTTEAYQALVGENAPMVICDLLATAVALHPELILEETSLYATVELASSAARGAISYDWYGITGKQPNVRLITKVDVPLFHTLFENLLRY